MKSTTGGKANILIKSLLMDFHTFHFIEYSYFLQHSINYAIYYHERAYEVQR